MQTLTIVLIAAMIILLIILAFVPCGVDHYADQVVHAQAGNIAGPTIQINEIAYAPFPGIRRMNEYIDMDDANELTSGIVGKTS